MADRTTRQARRQTKKVTKAFKKQGMIPSKNSPAPFPRSMGQPINGTKAIENNRQGVKDLMSKKMGGAVKGLPGGANNC